MSGPRLLRTALSIAAAYVLAVHAIVSAAALGAHAAEAASGLGPRIICLGAGGSADGQDHGGPACQDLCRIAGVFALDAARPPQAVEPARFVFAAESAYPETLSGNRSPGSPARDPPA